MPVTAALAWAASFGAPGVADPGISTMNAAFSTTLEMEVDCSHATEASAPNSRRLDDERSARPMPDREGLGLPATRVSEAGGTLPSLPPACAIFPQPGALAAIPAEAHHRRVR